VPDGIYDIDGTTVAAATDLGNVYSYLNGLTEDIILSAPTLLGHDLVLTPHTYLLGAAVTLTDTLYLDAFGIDILTINPANITDVSNDYYGDVSGGCMYSDTSANASLEVEMAPEITNGVVDQTVCIGSSASFSMTAIGTGLTYQWRKGTLNLINGGNISGANSTMLTINQANTSDISSQYNVVVSGVCSPARTSIDAALLGRVSSSDIADNVLKILVYPNPVTTSLNFIINDFVEENNCELKIFNLVGKEVIHTTITKQSTTLVTSNLRSGFYFYKVIENDQVIQTGKLILEN